MSRRRETSRFRTAMVICLVIGELQAFFLAGVSGNLSESGLALVVSVFFTLLLGVILGVGACFFPFAIVVLGLQKLFEQRVEVLDELGSENVVHEDPDGERKLHEYLSAITSMEARIGLLQQSTPYIPPEERAPESAKSPRARLSRTGWGALMASMVAGAIAGAFYGASVGVGDAGAHGSDPAVTRNVDLLRMFVSTMAGAVLSTPVGMVLALVFGRVEEIEDEVSEERKLGDDTGTGSPEAT